MHLAHPLPLALGVLLLVGGALLYRRRAKQDPLYGSQAAAVLLIVGLMLVIRGFGLLDYRPMGLTP